MSFQADHALTPNGAIVASLWTGLVEALAANTVNSGGSNYVLAEQGGTGVADRLTTTGPWS